MLHVNAALNPKQLSVWHLGVKTKTKSLFLSQPWYRPGLTLQQKRKELTQDVCRELIDLGPTYIKLGQFLSTRSDMFPPEVIEELSRLQDDVPPMRSDEVMTVLSEELGADYEKRFARFDMTPFAAASLGQVHKAQLHSGQFVAVKVQRIGLRETIREDMGILRGVAQMIDKVDTSNAHNLTDLCDENLALLRREIDYSEEAMSMERFRRDHVEIPYVHVPEVVSEFCTNRVLVTSYLPGIKIDNAKLLDAYGINRRIVAERLMGMYLRQIIESGFLHADVHPGNVRVLPGNELIYYDFGMMGEVPKTMMQRLSSVCVCLYTNDYETMYEDLNALGMLAPNADLASIMAVAALSRRYLEAGSFDLDSDDLLGLAIDKPFRLPTNFVLVLRSYSITEGVCKKLDPTFQPSEIIEPYGRALIEEVDFSENARDYGTSIAMLPTRIKHIENFISSLETGQTRLRTRSPVDEYVLKRLESLLYLLLAYVLYDMFQMGIQVRELFCFFIGVMFLMFRAI